MCSMTTPRVGGQVGRVALEQSPHPPCWQAQSYLPSIMLHNLQSKGIRLSPKLNFLTSLIALVLQGGWQGTNTIHKEHKDQLLLSVLKYMLFKVILVANFFSANSAKVLAAANRDHFKSMTLRMSKRSNQSRITVADIKYLSLPKRSQKIEHV